MRHAGIADVVDDDVGPAFGQQHGMAAPHAGIAAGAGDDRRPAVEPQTVHEYRLSL
jgi:hypothetical protein